MEADNKPCPNCGRMLSYRLGEYECDCGHREQAQQDNDEQAQDSPSGPGLRTPPPPPASYQRQRDERQASQVQQSIDSGYDPAPTLGIEKKILIGVFLLKAIVNVFTASMRPPDTSQILFSPIADTAGAELLNLGLLALVIFLPFKPLKWVCASLTCCYAFAGTTILLLGAMFLPMAGLVVNLISPGVPGTGTGAAFIGMLLAIVNLAVQFWLASVLFRDIHRMQAT